MVRMTITGKTLRLGAIISIITLIIGGLLSSHHELQKLHATTTASRRINNGPSSSSAGEVSSLSSLLKFTTTNHNGNVDESSDTYILNNSSMIRNVVKKTVTQESSTSKEDFTTTKPNKNTNHEHISHVGLVSYCSGIHYDRLRELVYYNHLAYQQSFDHQHRVSIFHNGGGDDIITLDAHDGIGKISTTTIMHPLLPFETFMSPGAWIKAAYLYQLLLISSVIEKSSTSTTTTRTTTTDNHDLSQIDWFVWMDCDSLIARYDISIPQLLQEKVNVQPHHHLVVADDLGYNSPFNTGVMFIRNNQWSLRLFYNCLKKAEKRGIRNHIWWEQYALHQLYRENLFDEQYHIKIVSNRSIFNAFNNEEYIDGESLIWHRVGCHSNAYCCSLYSGSFFCKKMPQQQQQVTTNTSSPETAINYTTHPRVNEICHHGHKGGRYPDWGQVSTGRIQCSG